LHVDVARRSLRLMTVDAWKPASSVDQFYKKGRFISEPAFDFHCILQFLTIPPSRFPQKSLTPSPFPLPQEPQADQSWRLIFLTINLDQKYYPLNPLNLTLDRFTLSARISSLLLPSVWNRSHEKTTFSWFFYSLSPPSPSPRSSLRSQCGI